jgi:hypothetical protein
MDNKFFDMLVGFFWGAVILFFITTIHWAPYKNKIEECESTLPRDQHCVLVAVPESEVGQ